MTGPLNGIKIIDLSSVISGPVATVLLADQGAEVIKVESPYGDIVRHMGASHNGISPTFVTANRGKRSICIDLKTKAGVEIVKKLVRTADVFVQNFRPGAIERMGLGYEQLRQTNPALLYVSISGFGDTGPYAHKRVYDPVIQALSGLPDIQADRADARPKMIRTIIPDKVSALTAAQAITAGLLERERGGEDKKGGEDKTKVGQHIQVAMLDATIAFLWPEALAGLTVVGKEDQVRSGQLAQDLVFATKDGYITCGAVSDDEWRGLCAALERPEWLKDERFNTPMGRVRNAKERLEGMADVLKSATSAEWLEKLDSHDVPCAPILTRPEILANEQVRTNELITQYHHPGLGEIRQSRAAAKFSRTDTRTRVPAPVLGEHTRELLLETGIPVEEIETLVKESIVFE